MKVGSLEIELLANIARLRNDMGQAKQTVEKTMSGIEKSVELAKRALAGLGSGLGIRELINLTDEYTKFTAQLKLATNSKTEYGNALASVRRISKDAQSDLAATGVLYARISNGARDLGVSQAKISEITETVSLALKVSGATAQESASAMLQLSQAFGSGVLRGEEFNAVNEAAPRLMRALADGLGVPIGQLRSMAEQGQLTSSVMAQVLPKALQDLRKEAESVQTISGSFTVLKNNVMEFVGTQAQASGAVSAITSGIGLIAQNLQLLVAAATGLIAAKFAQWVASGTIALHAKATALAASVAAMQASRAATVAETGAEVARLETMISLIATERARAIAQMQSAQATIAATAAMGAQSAALAANTAAQAANAAAISSLAALGKAQAVATAQLTAAQTAQSAALASTGTAAGLATRALGLLGGPIGIITTLLGFGVTAWMAWGGASESQEKRALNSVEKSTDEIIADLDRQISKLRERNALASAGMVGIAKSESPEAERMAKLRAQMASAQEGTGEFQGIGIEARTDILKKLGMQYGELYARIQSVNEEQAKLDSSGKAASDLIEVRQRLLGINKQYLDDLSKLEAARNAGAIGEQEYIALVSQLATETYKKSQAGKASVAVTNEMTAAQREALNAAVSAAQARSDARNAEYDAIEKYMAAEEAGRVAAVKAANDAVVAAQAEYDQYGKTKSQIAEITLLTLQSTQAKLAEGSAGYDSLQKQIEAQKELIGILQKSEVRDVSMKGAEDALKSLDAYLDPTKAEDFGTALANSFGEAGNALATLTNALQEYSAKQEKNDQQRLNAAKALEGKQITQAQYAQKLIALNQREAQQKVSAYASMAGAAKGFFKENSKGYQVMEATEKAFRTYEMAMSLEAMTRKIFFKQGEVAANLALNTTKIGGEAAATAASTGLAATEASAWGITAVVKALASLPFPANLVAGAATLAAVVAIGAKIIGGGGGGGGSVPTSKARQETQGTGTVLGDPTAKSESIANSLAIIEENSSVELNFQSSMLQALRNIESALGGAARGIFQTAGLTSGSAFGTMESEKNSTFGTSKKTTIMDAGIRFAGTFGQLREGEGSGSQYEDVEKWSDGGMFHSSKTKQFTNAKALTDEVMKPFTLIFDNMGDLLVDAGEKLGADGAMLTNAINQIAVDFEVSTRGLTGQDLVDALSAGISVALDQVATTIFPALEGVAKVGEGMGETLVRVASNYATLDVILKSIGGQFGATGIASVAAREHLIDLAGGIDELASATSAYAEEFLTEGERLKITQAAVTAEMERMGYAGITAKDQFREVVEGLVNSGALATEAGAAAYVSLMQIAPAFAEVANAADSLFEQQRDLEIQIMEASGDMAGALAAQRAMEMEKLDESLRPLQQTLYDLQDGIKGVTYSVDDMLEALAEGLAIAQNAAKTAMEEVKKTVAAEKQAARDVYDSKIKLLKEEEDTLRLAYKEAVKEVNAAKKQEQEDYKSATKAIATERNEAVAAYKLAVDSLEAERKAAADAYKANVKALDNERKSVVAAYQAATKAITAQITSAAAAVSSLKQLSESLKTALSSMRINGGEVAYQADAQAQIAAALAKARSGGGLPDAKDLANALRVVSQPSEDLYATFQDYQRDFRITENNIAALNTLAGEQLFEAETQLQVLESTRDLMTANHEALLAKLDEEREVLDRANELQQSGFDLQRELMDKGQEALLAILDDRKEALDKAYEKSMEAFDGELGRLATALEESLGEIDEARKAAAQELADKLGVLDDLLEVAQDEYDAIMGLTNALIPLPQALANLATALAGLKTTQAVVNGPAPSAQGSQFAMEILKEIKDAGGLAKLQAQQNKLIAEYAPTAAEIAKANDIYKNLLGRNAEGNSAAAFAAAIKAGTSEADLIATIKGSLEYQARQISESLQIEVNKLVNAALGTGYDTSSLFINGSHASGLDYVPFDGYMAELHRGEMVLPARVAQSVRGGGGGDNSELVDRMDRLIAENEKLTEIVESHLYSIAKSSLRNADAIEDAVNGARPLQTEEAA